MKLSPQWIRDFVDLAVDDRRLAEDLTNVGIAVEGISGSGADTMFRVEIGTNRPDAMNHYGVAREAAAIYDRPLKPLSAVSSQPSAGASTMTQVFLSLLEEPALCPRFSARVIRGTRIKPSPEKIAHRLQLLDQRPISNAVDATNYVLWEMGKPTHVFDMDLLEGGKIVVRNARAGETLKTLDGVERKLTSEDLVVCDAKARGARRRDGRVRHDDYREDAEHRDRVGVVGSGDRAEDVAAAWAAYRCVASV